MIFQEKSSKFFGVSQKTGGANIREMKIYDEIFSLKLSGIGLKLWSI